MNEKGIAAAALSIRSLSMDAIQKAKSGHPGIAMGASELAALLYGEIMKHNDFTICIIKGIDGLANPFGAVAINGHFLRTRTVIRY